MIKLKFPDPKEHLPSEHIPGISPPYQSLDPTIIDRLKGVGVDALGASVEIRS